ncbi:biotin transporter BioY [Propionibacterium sp. NM47_B9-13]|jgi:biotin transport system substrate-specific component|uniref:Biotin transporter n=2 Tax=Cutibacterium modestum TaxID=2559073 RepID=A0ABN0C1X3_9ACTN|nr:biotin transporter BioY [Cutibacterium modestum]EFS75219.1 BioY family protein [Cutibacterium modestum HL037PA2]EFS91119.1 BioY family protein [Cutibacterium modestum HL044PA1]EFT16808.1 BioY family protein [Cutibacterium modestum HL037PA3]EGG27649.1 BioY family protein [Cutibacterium modestum P08]MCP2378011.1 BioY family protein [Cutibacterium modestum 31N]TGY27276.1 biotin transporter BioY [Propionibacterium sp. NM47_B9-13]
MSSRNGFQATDLALIAVFAALIAVLAVIPPMFMVGAVPFALQMIAVMLTPMVLGSVRGGCAVGLYILVGALGLPVFSSGASGIGVLVGPTGGFLWGWLIGAFVAGVVATSVLRRRPRKSMLPVWLFLVALVDLGCTYLGGILGLMGFAKLSLNAALAANLVFFGLDVVKGILACLIATAVLTAFPRLMP